MTSPSTHLDQLVSRMSNLAALPVVGLDRDDRAKTTRSPRHRAWSRRHAHSHPFREIMVVLEGRVPYGVGKKTFRAVSPTVFFFDADVVHDQGYPPRGPDLVHLWMTVTPQRLLCRLICRHKGAVRFVPDTARSLSQPGDDASMDRLWDEALDGPVTASIALLSSLLSAVARYAMALARPEPGDVRPVQQQAVQAIVDRLMETGGRPSDLKTLARLAGYSPSHFHKLFRRQVGCTLGQYIDRCRLKRTEVLLNRGQSRKAIALDLGFSSPASFSRWYRKQGRPFD